MSTPDGIDWIPVRRRLGISAFGTNAFRAARAGDPVIEEHVESPGQEELYVVVSGRARFTVDGHELDAPAGTLVFVESPDVRRGAVAVEDGTVVFAVGGWPDQAYHSLPWEPLYLAHEAVRVGDWARAAETLEREAGEHLGRPIVRFRLACWHAQAGAHEQALRELRRAIDVDPEMRDRAMSENYLAPLRDHPGWTEAVG